MAEQEMVGCPFCGSDEGLTVSETKCTAWVYWWSVECHGCCVSNTASTREEAIAAWNTRARLDPSDASIAADEEAADLLARIVGLEAQVEELQREAEVSDADHADQNRMVDRIADLIGLPHDQELDTTAFELWFSARKDELPRMAEALEPFAEECDRQERVTDFRDGDCIIPRSRITIGALRRARAAFRALLDKWVAGV